MYGPPETYQEPQPHPARWMDEALTGVLIAPVPLAMTPWGADLVTHGMKALGGTPFWYQAGFYTMFAFVYGTRALRGVRDFLSIIPPRFKE